jgi:hypothetical protein
MSSDLNVQSPIASTSRRPLVAALIFSAIALASTWGAGEAFAQPLREAATAAATAPTRTPYQAYLAADCLDGSNFCKFNSEAVPDRARLEIQRVACQGWHTSTVPPTFVVIAELRTSADAFIGRIDFLKATYTPASWGSVWAIGEQTLMFIPAGHKLRITLNSGSTEVGSYGCTISGYMTTGL